MADNPTDIRAITMPKFGLSMTEGKVVSWAVPEGGHIRAGQEIADIETTKITNAYESPVSGVLRRHVAPEQEDLPVGALIGVVADPSVPDAAIDAFVTEFQAKFATRAAEAAAAAPEPQKVQAGGRAIRYLEIGPHEGRPVLFLHGFGGDLNNWLFTQPALARQHRAIALDLPGHGESSKEVGAGDAATLAAAVADFLHALDIAKAHLVGHSLGGAVAIELAHLHPSRVASLSLIAPAGLGPEIDGDFIQGFIAADRRKTMQPILEKLLADPALVTRDMIEDVLRFKRLDGATAALAAIAAANFPGGRQALALAGRIAAIAAPVQVIWGADDRILPASQAEGLPKSVAVHIIPKSGHMPHLEAAGEVNRLVEKWVGE